MYVLTFIARPKASLEGLTDSLKKLDQMQTATFTFADEIQVTFQDAEQAVRAAMLGASYGTAWIGIGCAEDFETAGQRSRAAVEYARTGSPVRFISVVAGKSQRSIAEQASGVLRLMYRTVAERSEAEQKVISLVVPGVRGQLKSVAQVLKISPQAVSKTLTRAKWHEEQACYPAVTALFNALDS